MGDSSLIIRIGADASGVKDGVKEATVHLKELGSSSIEVAHDFVELAEKAIEAGKAITEFLLGSSLENIDAQAKLARNIGSTIDGLRSLQLFAKDAGISADGLNNASAKLNTTIGQGLAGNEKATRALNDLYLNASKLQGLDADQKMAVLADAIHMAGLSTEETVAALRELGIKGGTELVNSMRMGGDAIRAARKEVEEFGVGLSDVDARKVEAANDAMDRMKLALEAVQQHIAIALAPIITALAEKFNDLTKSTGGFKSATQSAVEYAIAGFKKAADVIYGVRVAFKAVELGLAIVASAIMDVIDTVITLGATLYDAVTVPINGWIKIANAFGANFQEISSAVSSDFTQGMHAATDAVQANVVKVYDELTGMLAAPLPSTAIDDFVTKANAAAQAAAAAQSAAQPGNNAANDAMQKADDERRAHQALVIDEDGMFNTMLLQQSAQLEDDLTANAAKGAASRAALSKQIRDQQIGDVVSMASNVLGAYSTHSKKMFEMNKALNIGMAIMNTFKGVSESLASYPMPLAAVMAALHLAMGLANVANIRSQQFGSTSASGSSSTSSATADAAATTTTASAGSGNTLMVQGIDSDSLFSGSMVKTLAEKLSQHTADGGKLVIA